MLFQWQEHQIRKRPDLNKNNEALIKKLKSEGITNVNILRAIEKVPREIFVEQKFYQHAYENIPLPIDCKQTISQPYIVAYMISCLNLKKSDKVLEIGTGSGYQTAILSNLCKSVYTIEIHSKLLDKAKKNIKDLNLENIVFKLGNGAEGWKNKILFDNIIISAASEIIPTSLFGNLKNKGYLIMPKIKPSGNQKLVLIKKNYGSYIEKELFNVKFVPLLNKAIQ